MVRPLRRIRRSHLRSDYNCGGRSMVRESLGEEQMIFPDDYINQVICGDSIEIMKMMPNKCVNMILTDPPYGIDYLSNWTHNNNKIENDELNDWQELMPKFLIEAKRVLTDTGCCCCCCGGGGKTPVTSLFTLEAIKHFNLIQILVWRKFIGLGWRYRPAYENIVILSKSKDNYSFYDETKSCSNVIEGINQDIPQAGDHPTQKPVELMQKLLLIHSKENDIVLDCFAGGGSTLEACKNLSRKFIGIEISEKYCEISRQRLRQEILL